MINKSVNEKSKDIDIKKQKTTSKPNELGGVYFFSHIKIFDPKTKEIFVQKRVDQ